MDYNNKDQIEDNLNTLTVFLRKIGEPLTSERSGIHFHVSVPYNLRILKSIVRLGANLEDFYFYLGGFGYEHRGNKNNHIYCRPITQYGPTVVKYSSTEGHQVFNIKDLLDAKDVKEFWWRYYATARDGGRAGDHYSPVRYHWLNLLSLIQKGSLEFRVFNKTLNVDYIMAALEVCTKFVDLAMVSSYDTLKTGDFLSKNSIYLDRSKEEIVNTFNIFADRTNLSEKTYSIVQKIIKQTPHINIDKEYCFTHKQGYDSPFKGSDYHPELISLKSVKTPNFVDIHVLRGERGGERNEERGPRFDPRELVAPERQRIQFVVEPIRIFEGGNIIEINPANVSIVDPQLLAGGISVPDGYILKTDGNVNFVENRRGNERWTEARFIRLMRGG
jgi:hypothetical protein